MARMIGIAGYMGAGKSTAVRLLAGLLPSALVIDADGEAKTLMRTDRSVRERLVETFGAAIAGADGPDFGALGRIVFGSPEKLGSLNAVVHPPLVKRLLALIETAIGRDVLLDAALLPLWGIDKRFDACLWVEAPFDVRLARLRQARSDLDDESLRHRMRMQERSVEPPLGPQWRRIENRGDIAALKGALALFAR
jgi:dephospho-CoA kinase